MISSAIMQYTCTFTKVIGHVYDAIGCPISDVTSSPYVEEVSIANVPCYVTTVGNAELKEANEPNRATHLLYVNPGPGLAVVDKTYKVVISGVTYSIINVDECFDGHLEFYLTTITKD